MFSAGVFEVAEAALVRKSAARRARFATVRGAVEHQVPGPANQRRLIQDL
jgi:hypothetical protein